MHTYSQSCAKNRVLLHRLIAILLLAAFCLVLGGCKKESNNNTASTTTRAQDKAPVSEPEKAGTAGVLTGKWTGKYYYEDGRKSVEFSGTVQQTGEKLEGQFSEPRTDFGPMLDKVTFTFAGSMVNNHVLLVKTYSYNTNHKVNYSGTYYPEEKKIKGTWSIDKSTGNFEISVQN